MIKRIALLALFACVTFAGVYQPVSAGSNNTCWVYQIDIEGVAEGTSFSGSGAMYVFPYPVISNTGSNQPANQWEFRIQLGTPLASPQAGSIFFVTNSALVGQGNYGNAQLQMATIRSVQDRNGSYFVAEPFLYESQTLVNAFNISSGLLADAKIITAGGVAVAFSEDQSQVGGVIDLVGRNWMTVGTRADMDYDAQFQGRFVEETTRCYPNTW